MSKKDWIGLIVYAVALILVLASLTWLPDHGQSSPLQFFQR